MGKRSTNRLQLLGWQPITAKIAAIIAASSGHGLLIGQFLVYPAIFQPIHRDQVGALVSSNAVFILFILQGLSQKIGQLA